MCFTLNVIVAAAAAGLTKTVAVELCVIFEQFLTHGANNGFNPLANARGHLIEYKQ